MTKSPRHRWQTHWRLSHDPPRALHDSGLLALLHWRGASVVAIFDQAQPAFGELAAKHGPHNFPQMLARLAREAEALALADARGETAKSARLTGGH